MINLNAATEEELARVAGIGPARAQRIVEYRRVNGRFVSTTELRYVEDIPPSELDALSHKLRV